MPTLQSQSFRSIYDVAKDIGTTPASLRSLIAKGKLQAEKASLKHRVRPINVFTKTQEQIARAYFSNKTVYHKRAAVKRKSQKREEQLVFDMKEVEEVPFMVQKVKQDQIYWANTITDPKTGKRMYQFDSIEFHKLIAHLNVRTVTNHPKIGWCFINKKEGGKR
jgi:hypothetical protein